MPINFKRVEHEDYFVAIWTGKITDDEMINSYKDFLQGLEWSSELNELADLSQADMSEITSEGIKTGNDYTHKLFEEHGVISSKTAVYAPKTLEFGMARMYQLWTDTSPEEVKVFKDLDAAISWLKS